MFKTITIIGLGLIGSSLARDVRNLALAERIIGIDKNQEYGDFLLNENVINEFHLNSDMELSGLIILAVPPALLGKIAAKLLLTNDAIIIDVASVKEAAIREISPYISKRYIPTHPIAGSVKIGATAGKIGLFKAKKFILTPIKEENETLNLVLDFIRKLGAIPEIMDAKIHDEIYAVMSHLPQIIAYIEASIFGRNNNRLRISSSNPALWTDIILFNKEYILSAMRDYLQIFSHLVAELKSGSSEENETEDKEDIAKIFSYISASCLVNIATIIDNKISNKISRYAGNGFIDMTSPITSDAEEMLKKISNNSLKIVEKMIIFESILRDLFAIIKKDDKLILNNFLEELCKKSIIVSS